MFAASPRTFIELSGSLPPRVAQFYKSGAGFGGLIPRGFIRAVDDAALVALAKQEHNIAGAGLGERGPDGLRPIGTLQACAGLGAASISLLDPFGDLSDNRVAIFKARVFIGEHNQIAELCSRLALDRPLLAIALPSASKDRNQAPISKRSNDPHQLLKRARRMGIVDKHSEWLALINTFHAATNAGHLAERGERQINIDTLRQSDSEGRQRIMDVEIAGQAQLVTILSARTSPWLRTA
jgi:hypothetical protein